MSCWYFIYIHYCGECGHETWYRERVIDRPKPEKPEDRREYLRVHCGCISGRFA